MRIAQILNPKCVVLDLEGSSKREVLEALAQPLIDLRPDVDRGDLINVLVKREEASSTAIADGIAIPHGKVSLGEEVLAVFGRNSGGLDFGSVDGQPTKLFFLLVSPESHPSLHLRWLAHIASLLKNPEFRNSLLAAETPDEVLSLIDEEERARPEPS